MQAADFGGQEGGAQRPQQEERQPERRAAGDLP